MNLHEYQAKQLFAEFGIPVPEGQPATDPAGARAAAEALGGGRWVFWPSAIRVDRKSVV